MKKSVLLGLLLAGVAALAACGSGLTVTTDYDQTADFRGWTTYRWAERSETARQDPRVYNDLTDRRVKEAADAALQAKGYRRIESGEPDFYVGWHGALETKVDVTTVYDDYRYDWGYWDPRFYRPTYRSTYVNEYEQGTLILDIIDADASDDGGPRLVWRGTATAVVESRPSPGGEKLKKAVQEILAGFPPQ